MASDLQRQVAALQAQRVATATTAQGKPSLFLSKKEAGNVDTSAVLEAAVTGLRALAQYDDRFSWCFDTLLHPSSVDFQRELKTKEENKSLDAELGRLLELLSLWSTEPNAHLVLEYLVRRYRVHEFNTDKLIRCMISAHDTKIFGKVAQLCKVENTMWSFLMGAKESGGPLPRSVLVKKVDKNSDILEAIVSAALTALQLVGIRQTPVDVATNVSAPVQEGAQRIISFLNAVVVEVSSKHSFDENKMRSIYLYLVEGLKTPLSAVWGEEQLSVLMDWKASCYMIVTQLCRTTVLGDSFVKAISNALAEALLTAKKSRDERGPRIAESGLNCLLVLAQAGQVQVSTKVLASLFVQPVGSASTEDAQSWFGQVVLKLVGSSVVVQPLTERVAEACVKVLTGELSAEESKVQAYKTALAADNLARHVQSLVQSKTVSDAFLQQLLASIFAHVLGLLEVDVQPQLKEVVRGISNWAPVAFDAGVQQAFTSQVGGDVLSAFLSEVFSQSSHHMLNFSGDSLFVALNSPVLALRMQGLDKLAAMAVDAQTESTSDLIGLAEAALRCVVDYDATIAAHVFVANVVKFTLAFVSPVAVFERIREAWTWWYQYGITTDASKAESVLQSIVKSLSDASVVEALATTGADSIAWLHSIVFTTFAGDRFQVSASAFSWKSILPAVLSLMPLLPSASAVYDHALLRQCDEKDVKKSGRKARKPDAVPTAIRLDEADLITIVGEYISANGCTWSQTLLSKVDLKPLSFAFDRVSAASLCHILLQSVGTATHAHDVCVAMIPVACQLMGLGVSAAEVTLVSQFFAALGASSSANASVTDWADMVESVSAEATASHAHSMRLLTHLVLSRDINMLELFDQCLHGLFGARTPVALYQLVFFQNSEVSSDDALFLQLVGLKAWIVYVRCLVQSGKDASLAVMSSICVALWAGNHSDSRMRDMVESLVSVLLEMDDAVVLSFSVGKNTLAPLLGENLAWTAGELSAPLCQLLQEKQSVISLQAGVVGTVVSSWLDGKKHAGLVKFLWATVDLLRCQHEGLTALLVSSLAAVKAVSFWVVIRHILDRSIASNEVIDTVVDHLLRTLVNCYAAGSAAEQSSILDYVLSLVQISNEHKGANVVKAKLLVLLKKDVCHKLEGDQANKVFQQLFATYLVDSLHQPALLEVLVCISVGAATTMAMFRDEAKMFLDFKASHHPEGAMEVAVDEESKPVSVSGCATALKRMTMVVEVAAPVVLKAADVDVAHLSVLARLLLDLLKVARDPQFKVVISHDFSKAVLVELADKTFVAIESKGFMSAWVASLAQGDAAEDEAVETKKKSRKSTKPTPAVSVEGQYCHSRVVADVLLVMTCMGELRQAQAQHHAFGVVRTLLKLHPDAISAAIEGLGKLLASAQLGQHVSKERFLTGVLEVLLPALTSESDKSQDSKSVSKVMKTGLQLIVQNLCQELPSMMKVHRRSLLRTALKVMKDDAECVYLVVHTLLLHTIAAYEREYAARVEAGAQVDSVCLSRAGQRRAQRLLHASVPEEFFQLAVSLLLNANAVEVLSKLLCTSMETMQLAVKDHTSSDHSVAVDLESSLQYVERLCNKPGTAAEFSATLSILHIELVLEVLENKDFHLVIAKQMTKPQVQAHSVQHGFLEVADVLLQLVNFAEHRKALTKQETKKNYYLPLRLEEKVYSISHGAMMGVLSSSTMDALQSLQLLFDAPTFISIFQELLAHDVLAIRQKALLVLRERLQRLLKLEKPSIAEMGLYLDLSAHVRDIIRKHAEQLLSGSSSGATAGATQTALVQSAIMCLDILIQLLGGHGSWAKELDSVLQEFVSAGKQLYLKAQAHADNSTKSGEMKKLTGSMFLCIATCCKMLGAGSLPHVPEIMDGVLNILSHDVTAAIQVSASQAESPHHRSELLFLQSMVSTCTVMVLSLPTFMHPYLPKTMSHVCKYTAHYYGLQSRSKEQLATLESVDGFFSTLGAKVPPRLLLPVMLTCAEEVFVAGHDTSLKFAQLVRSTAEKADRGAIISQLSKWLSLSLTMLDYRRCFGDRSPSSEQVEHEINSSITELCLKLTETELKAFVVQINDWKNKSEERGALAWTRDARYVSFYGLVYQLLEKLKFLFHPTFALFWNEVPEIIKYVAKTCKKVIAAKHGDADSAKEAHGSAKKRKRGAAADADLDETQRQNLDEMINLSTLIVTCVQGLCADSDVPFINEERYESVAGVMLEYLSLRQAFSTDSSFLEFVTSIVSPALTAITSATSNDLMWKPVNHQILMLTRSSSVAVRRASITILKDLFVGVGDDYTALLPECLPFLSELLEDDHNDVVADTRRAISSIEELTGEKLDTYFQ